MGKNWLCGVVFCQFYRKNGTVAGKGTEMGSLNGKWVQMVGE